VRGKVGRRVLSVGLACVALAWLGACSSGGSQTAPTTSAKPCSAVKDLAAGKPVATCATTSTTGAPVFLCEGPGSACTSTKLNAAMARYYALGGATKLEAQCLAEPFASGAVNGTVPPSGIDSRCGVSRTRLDQIVRTANAYLKLHPKAAADPSSN
jgi:hypothetical protein